MRHRRHIFVCVQRRDGGGGKPACGQRGGSEILGRIETLLIGRPDAQAGVTGTQCLGPCFDGPNAVVYPDGIWYGELSSGDADRLVEHLCDGRVLAEKIIPDVDD